MTKVLIFDTETTGLCPRGIQPTRGMLHRWDGCRIVQIAWELWEHGITKPLESKVFTVQPDGFVIPSSASRIHGITTEQAIQEGVPMERVLQELHRILDDVDVLVAHNLDFDMSVLSAELLRQDREDMVTALQSKKQVCTMKRGTEKNKKWPKLCELYEQSFGVSAEEVYGELHRADVDVRCCADIYFHQETMSKNKMV